MLGISGTGWNILKTLVQVSKRPWRAAALNKVAKTAKQDIEKNIDSKGSYAGKTFLPNARLTVAAKGFDHPWVETGGLRNSVEVIKLDRNSRMVGWSGKYGDIARTLELGAVVPVTQEMRDKLKREGITLSVNVQSVVIPPRPNLSALAKKYISEGTLEKYVIGSMKEVWGSGIKFTLK